MKEPIPNAGADTRRVGQPDGTAAAPAAQRGTIAYVVAEFPSISETFILREILALGEAGYRVELFSLRRPQHSPKVHAEALALGERTHYPAPCLSRQTVRAQFFFLARQPVTYGLLLARAMRRMACAPADGLKRLRHLLIATLFARQAMRHGVTHVHAHFVFVTADVASVMAALLGKRFSVSAHAWDIYQTDRSRIAERLRDAAFVATCSQYNRDQLLAMRLGIPDDRLHVAYHGVDIPELVAEPSRSNLVLAVGRLEEKKGFRHLVEACGMLRDRGAEFRCVIAGEGAQGETLRRQIAERGLAGVVSLAGELTQEELAPLLRSAAMLVAPSIVTPAGDRDALPNVILEAMAMGLPVVASGITAIPEAVEDGQTGFLVPPGETETLADRIHTLLSAPDLRTELGKNGRERAAARFDARQKVAGLAKLFDKGAR